MKETKRRKRRVKKAAARNQLTAPPGAGKLSRRNSGQLQPVPSNCSRAVVTNDQKMPKVAKKPGSRIPEPQIVRILQRHVMGQSQRQIAREEERSRPAIARIVKSEEMTAYVQRIREQFAGLAEDASNNG